MAFLTRAQAQARADRLAHHIRKYGVKVVVDLRTGAGGNHWGVDTHIGAMAHHIVSRRSQGSTPFYSLVRNGRSDVPGPLCNIYGGWDLVARIVTMGLANHSGRGGPWVISGRRIPRDNGRYYFLGTEFEGGLREADWTPEYRRFMGAVNAGKLDYLREINPGLNLRDTALCEHSSWAPGRKIDRLGYTQASGIAEMQAARAQLTPTPAPTPERTWFDMATKNDLRDVVRAELDDVFNQRIKLTGSSAEAFGPDFRAGALLAYAARGGLAAHEPTVQAIGKLVGKSTSEILAAITEANADVELPEDDDGDGSGVEHL